MTLSGFDLQDRLFCVTGGAGLLGKVFCTAIAAAGGRVIVSDHDADRAQATAEAINAAHPGRAIARAMDITDETSVTALLSDLPREHGPIHGLVNNAYPRNARYGRKLEEVTYADFCDNMALHAGGYFLTSQKFAAYLAATGGGSIVNLSSIYGVIAPRFEVYEGTPMTMPVEYAAIKAAVLHLTRYFAQYYRKAGVRVNAISPGGIFDNQPEPFVRAYGAQAGQKGMLDKEDLAGTLVYLLSDAARHMTGQNLIVDDGFTL